jgi:hypothetical protein
MMSLLLQAATAEVEGRHQEAIEAYQGLVGNNSAIDEVGICQALARCSEKLGRRVEAAKWRYSAGSAYLDVPASVMERPEALYYALLELRAADRSGKK